VCACVCVCVQSIEQPPSSYARCPPCMSTLPSSFYIVLVNEPLYRRMPLYSPCTLHCVHATLGCVHATVGCMHTPLPRVHCTLHSLGARWHPWGRAEVCCTFSRISACTVTHTRLCMHTHAPMSTHTHTGAHPACMHTRTSACCTYASSRFAHEGEMPRHAGLPLQLYCPPPFLPFCEAVPPLCEAVPHSEHPRTGPGLMTVTAHCLFRVFSCCASVSVVVITRSREYYFLADRVGLPSP